MEKLMQRLPLYVRIAWAFVVLFGMVGEFTGHRMGAALVFIISTVMWTCMRIIAEAAAAYNRLRDAWAQDDIERDRKRQGPDKRDDEPPFPPTAVA